jgi:hypothetical protein
VTSPIYDGAAFCELPSGTDICCSEIKACYYLQMSWRAACAFVSPIMILQVFKMIMVALQPLEGSDSKAHKEVQVLIEDNLRLC